MKFFQVLAILSVSAIAIAAPVVEERFGKPAAPVIVTQQTCNPSGNMPLAACCPTAGLLNVGCTTLPLGLTSMTCAAGFVSSCCSTNGVNQANNNQQQANGNKGSVIVQGNYQSINNCAPAN